MRKIRTFICAGCGKEVTGRFRKQQRFCSATCYSDKPRPERKTGQQAVCDFCGGLFYLPRYRSEKAKHFFCSLDHQIAWQGRNKDNYTCKICGRGFRWSPSRKAQSVLYCSLACRDADPDRHTMLIEMNAAQQRGHRTKTETIGYGILDAIGVAYQPQHVIGGKFCVDAFLSKQGLIVQFDGDYWHGHPEKFPNPDSRQRKRMRLDASQDAYMRACGYTVLRFWECDLHTNPDQVRLTLLEHL